MTTYIYITRDRNNRFFQTPDKTSDTIKYLPGILKIHRTSFQRVWVLEFKRPQLVYLLKCITTTFGVYRYSFCEMNTYCVITQKNLIHDRKQLNNSRVMQVLLMFFKKTLDKQNDQVSPEFKVKVNNGRCLQQVCSPLIVRYIM